VKTGAEDEEIQDASGRTIVKLGMEWQFVVRPDALDGGSVRNPT